MGIVAHHLEKLTVVCQLLDHFQHIICLVGVIRDDLFQEVTRAVCRVFGKMIWWVFHVVAGQVAEQLLDGEDGILFICGDEVSHTAFAGVHFSATEVGNGHLFVEHRLHHFGACHKHIAVLLFHDHKVCDRRRVDGSTCTGAQDGGNLRDHAAGHHVAPENLGITGQSVHSLLDTGTATVVETDHGTTVFQRHIHDLADLLCIGLGK